MKRKIIISLYFLLFVVISVNAQYASRISVVIDSLMTKKGTVFVQMGKDALEKKTQISFYKSLMVYEKDNAIDAVINKALAHDIKDKDILSEVKKNGALVSGNYYLGYNKQKNRSEYILYKKTPEKTTVIFMAGGFLPEKFEAELKKLKDLFISINKGKTVLKGLELN